MRSKKNFIYKVSPFDGILDGKPYLLVTVRDPRSGRTEGRVFPREDLLTLSGEFKLMTIIRQMMKQLTSENK